MRLLRSFAVAAAALLSASLVPAAADAAPAASGPVLMRYPSSSATALAFVAYGDLWTAPRDGGTATRRVRSAGRIVAARFSPDGRWIAYTERRAGGQDVYVVAAAGG